MEWTRSETLALALQGCTSCRALGLRIGKRGGVNPCNCVLRNIFRACFNRFRYCSEKEKHLSRATMEFVPGKDRRMSWGRKDEEYCADFLLISKRTLTEEEHKVFTFHYLLGADWKLCCARMKIDRGQFFHCVYRIEQRLGRTFRELTPYALFPLSEYFHSTKINSSVEASDFAQAMVIPIRPPLKKIKRQEEVETKSPLREQEDAPLPLAA